jgi:hypothetical protein
MISYFVTPSFEIVDNLHCLGLYEFFAPNRDPSECFAVVSAIAAASSFSGRKFFLSLPTLPSEVQASLVVLSGPKSCRIARLRCSCMRSGLLC